MDFSNIFNEKTILFGIHASHYDEAIRLLGNLLYKEGYVKDTYIQAVIDREKEFPTGLSLGKENVALPHTDSIHVDQQGIALGIFNKPIEFSVMGNSNEVVPVRLVFLMAIKENDGQVKMLQMLIDTIQKPTFIDDLLNAQSKAEIIEILRLRFTE